MQFQSIGGIFLRLDSSGNLNIYDTTGTSIAKFVGGNYSSKLNKSASVTNSNITTTTSTSDVSMGLGCSITPQISGNVLLTVIGVLANGTASDGAVFSIYQNTTGIPAGGVAVGGDSLILTSHLSNNANTAALQVPASMTGLAISLTLGTKYYFYVAGSAQSGGTATVSPGSASVIGIEV